VSLSGCNTLISILDNGVIWLASFVPAQHYILAAVYSKRSCEDPAQASRGISDNILVSPGYKFVKNAILAIN
jgi:hypothetical protein